MTDNSIIYGISKYIYILYMFTYTVNDRVSAAVHNSNLGQTFFINWFTTNLM